MTLLAGLLLVVVLGAVGGTIQVPYVALGPGPTFNTLGQDKGTDVITIKGATSYRGTGHLNMTTVSVRDGLTLFGALGLWVNGRDAVVPRETVYPPDQTTQQVEQQNTQDFQRSESSAVVSALRYLKYPFTVTVGSVTKKSPSAGVLAPGDRLTSIDGTAVTTAAQVSKTLTGTRPGQSIKVGYVRNGAAATGTVVLGHRPEADEAQGFLGIAPADSPDVPFTVDISLANIGGPSAGLMFALGVVDKLTPGQLNNGAFVAGTGTITNDGTVGPIGGIPFKMVAAKEAGATTFLVPSMNCKEAKANAPAGLDLVKVDTLTGAVTDLDHVAKKQPVPHC